jgi:cell division protein FtsQ
MDADAYAQEVLEAEEPKYLRRQKPVEIKRRKFGRKAWKTYLRVTAWAAAGIAGAGCAYGFAHFLLASPEMALIHPEQVELTGNTNVSRASVLDIFRADRGHSVLRIPLDERRRQLESIPWIEQATVRRALPHTIQVEIVERTPIAFLREGNEMALVDVHGVILDRPLQGKFHFPVVTGIHPGMAAEEREKRMQLFAGFMQQLDLARAGAFEEVSEVDLSDAHDLRASLTGFQTGGVLAARSTSSASTSGASSSNASSSGTSPRASSETSAETWGDADAPILVHFGDSDFEAKYQTLLDKMGQWRATAGRVESVDLRFNGEAVVNSDTPPPAPPAQTAQRPVPAQKHAAAAVAKHTAAGVKHTR